MAAKVLMSQALSPEPVSPPLTELARKDAALAILVAEDDQDIREMVTLLVKRMGHTVYTATTGKEAFAQLHAHSIDIVLLDIMMPEMDGFELCRLLRDDAVFQDLHIIITSAKDTIEDKIIGLELGAADYLTKPFSLAELRARIGVGERIVRTQKTLKEQQTMLEQVAREDALTGLHNRRSFEERAEEECTRALRYSHPLAILFGDIDHFKRVNDSYGHAQGDNVLKRVAQTLLDICRTNDTIARYGGEEFAILLPETGPDEAQVVADRLCAAVRALSFSSPTEPFQVTISIGLVSLPPGCSPGYSELLEQADEALYTAKGNGRDRVECWRGH